MFSKLSSKVKSLVDETKTHPGAHKQQSYGPTGGGQANRAPLGSGGRGEIMRYRFWSGVNLGSWFTLEKWISDKPFEGATSPGSSDLDICRSSRATEQKRQTLEHHWDTWIVESDFEWLSQRGINTVRIPISYYHLVGLDPSVIEHTEFDFTREIYEGAWSRILRAIEWANKYNIGVLVDLHAVPGKQNGDSHAGASHEARLFKDKTNQTQTVKILEILLRAVSGIENVIGLELMNEPENHPQLQKFHIDTLNRLHSICGVDFPLIISDAWQLDDSLRAYYPTPTFTLIDTHVYRCFTAEDSNKSAEQLASEIRGNLANQFGSDLVKNAGGRIIVGEWSGALNPGSLHGSQGGEQDAKRRNFVRAQLEVFEHGTSGYFFWTFRKQDGWDAGWSFKDACRAEIVPGHLGSKYKGELSIPYEQMAQHRDSAFAAHCHYWDNAVKKPMEHDRFASGFTTGWTDSLLFFTSRYNLPNGPASELPAAGGQWKVRRREEHLTQRGPGEFVWEWEHGYEQGQKAATDLWKQHN